MPSVRAQPKHFVHVAPSKESLEYADLQTLDFSLWEKGEEGKDQLAKQIDEAMRTQGFFYVINHGVSAEQIERMTDIGWTVLSETPMEEKKRLEARIQETGLYDGFKLRNYYQ